MRFNEIENPPINPEDVRYRRWSYQVLEGMTPEWIMDNLKSHGISPKTHPKVCDLCSGDGSIPAILADNGWRPENITGVDIFKSPQPLIEGIEWRYFDVQRLVRAIQTNSPLPPDLLQMQSSYDLVTMFQGHTGLDQESEACKFFVKPGGYILCP